ncbi:MAG: polysaccharide biosynthesis protein [bacterium]|nr:polysaccharide biosynthesis protein [bacterium]
MILDGKAILVTGGTGSLGQVLVRRMLTGELGTPRKIIVMSRDEAKQHAMRVDYMNRKVTTDEVIYHNFEQVLEFRIGDVRSYADVCSAIRDVDIVANAAALKQVPTCEYFPGQAVATNCQGPENIVRAIRENGYPVETVIGISTDKACKPVNVMGMTKAIQERILLAANILIPSTRFVCVRYGNVLSSRGSVVPLFDEQIRAGGPVTLTSPNMTRFLLSLDDAVNVVFQAVREARSGETYIPIVRAARVTDIARAMIGSRSIETKLIGVRPGEKLAEVLVSEEECHHVVRRGDYYVILPLLPELRGDEEPDLALEREYSSNDDLLDLDGTVELLDRHGLLPDQVTVESEKVLS